MPTDVIMPQMGESIFEGTITKWLKKAGDRVEKDEPLFEISTDKVDAEIPSPVAGVLSEIKIAEGETVQINTVVAVVAESGSAAAPAAPAKATPAKTSAPAEKAPAAPEAQAAAKPAAAAKSARPAATQDQADGATTDAAASGKAPAAPTGGTDVVMPQMGESIFEGTITKWLKQPGDRVEKDEPLFEISTDKVDAEIPSPVAGVLSEIKVAEGATVQINTVVAVIGGAAAAQGAGDSASSAEAKQPAAAAPEPRQEEPEAASDADAAAGTGQRLRSSPLVRRIAKDNSLDLRQVAGTGSGGRITKEDILAHLSENDAGSATQAKPESTATAGATSPAAAPSTPQAQPAASQLPGSVVPLTKMRAIIAQRMVESVQISPHVHSVFKVDMTRIVRLRDREKENFEQRNAVKLTYMPFIAAAAIECLRKFPIVNASMEQGAGGNSIRYHQNINLGIAVALDWGLIVPVVKQAEERSFLGLARAIADLAQRARSKRLKPDEASGSTFTLTNSGIFGEEFGLPIINQPDSAILAIGGLKKEPAVLTDAEGNDSIAIRSMQHFCLGFDHRTIDGADAGRFMAEFKKVLEGWDKEIG
jgi:pyruvate dehydrogenase E2 component (dihydrolipoamide acetyltransferase)